MFILQFGGWLIFSCILMSFVEHQIHRKLLIALVSWEGAAAFVAVMIFHHWAWNKIHLEMHKPEQRVFSTWPVYKFLARYHCLHHRHLDKNFNVVFPLADYVLGTSVRANESDLKYMEQWGV
jgi:hemerythrin-like domain-containing protein